MTPWIRSKTMIRHPFDPFYDKESGVLILGSFPSVKSREQMFYYGHPMNRFWRVLSRLTEDELPVSIEEKKAFLKRHHIALFDTIASCDITGSSDASIKNAVPNDLSPILNTADIRAVITNGKKSHELYRKYIYPVNHREDLCLPSTSPANAVFTLDKLCEEWSVILPFIG